MEIPFHKLQPDTLDGIIVEFVSREGTDYGLREYSLEEKVLHVRRQLESGDATIVFDLQTETCNIVPAAHRQVG